MQIAILAVKILVFFILFSAGWAKARDPKAFADVVRGLGVLPDRAVGPTAGMLPWAEMGIALALVWPSLAPFAAILAAGLLGIFSAVLAAALARGDTPECGCFGALATTKASWRLVARNLVLMALLVPVAFHLEG